MDTVISRIDTASGNGDRMYQYVYVKTTYNDPFVLDHAPMTFYFRQLSTKIKGSIQILQLLDRLLKVQADSHCQLEEKKRFKWEMRAFWKYLKQLKPHPKQLNQ